MKTEIGKDIDKAIWLLKRNKVIAIPTETVYGLACNALSENAILKVYKIKNRPLFRPINLQVDSIKRIYNYVESIPKPMLKLIEKFSPGPLTCVLPKKNIIPELLTAGLPMVGIRIPQHSMTLKLLESLNFPLAVPSANLYSFVSLTSAESVFQELEGKIPYILDGGISGKGIESTIVEYSNNSIIVLRKGIISIEQIQAEIKDIQVNTQVEFTPETQLQKYHTRTIFTSTLPDILLNNYSKEEIGYITFSEYSDLIPKNNQKVLSIHNNMEEATRNFFGIIKEIDNLNLKIISIQKVNNTGFGTLINERIDRLTQVG